MCFPYDFSFTECDVGKYFSEDFFLYKYFYLILSSLFIIEFDGTENSIENVHTKQRKLFSIWENIIHFLKLGICTLCNCEY